jgi:hypothetical protein
MLDRIAWTSAALMALGWLTAGVTAAFLGSGHSQLAAYVGLLVICSSWGLGPLGALCGAAAMSRDGRSRRRGLAVEVDVALTLLATVVFFA